LPTVILAAAVLITAVYSFISIIAYKPTVTEGEFPFSITYELDGEKVTIKDVYKVNYVKNDEDDNHKGRVYVGKLLSSGEETAHFTLKKDGNTRIELWTNFHADYLMGDPENDYFDDEAFEPKTYYFDENETEFYDEETLEKQGFKLISFEYPTPLENSLEFSHISYLSGANVLPLMLIALLTLIATLIFVRKEKDIRYNALDIISIVLNCIIGTVYLGFVTILALLIDIEGGGPELYFQTTYFTPVVTLLSIVASIGLRRKGYRKSSFFVQFIGPLFFAVYLFVFFLEGLF
jgi:hypothetical protein